MAKQFSVCPNCKRKGVYVAHGYDPQPDLGPWERCRYCNYNIRTNRKGST